LKSTIYNDFDITNNEPKNNPSVNESFSNDKPMTTTNKVKKEKDIIERKEVFKKQIFQFQNQFSKEVLNNFYNYWTEENRQTGRLKFEDEKYWNLESRLHNWKQFTTNKKEQAKINLNR
jgi:flagellar motor component MotA